MAHSYLTIAQQGKNCLWRYVLGICLIFFWAIIGGFFGGISVMLFFSDSQQRSPIALYIASKIPDAFFCLGIFLAVKWLHQRKFSTLISAAGAVSLKRLLLGFGVWSLLLAISLGVSLLLNPQAYSFTFNPSQWFLFLPLALVLTPLQTSAEEFLFRGYLLQGLSCITRQPFVLVIVTSLLFAILHFPRTEIQRGAMWMALYYFAWAVFMTVITLKDNRLELALGVHAATNLYGVLFVKAKDAAVATPTVWTTNPSEPKLILVLLLVLMAVFYYVFFGRRRKRPSVGQNRVL